MKRTRDKLPHYPSPTSASADSPGIAQDPSEAEYDGMPQSAIATGLVDLVLPVAEIPAAILRFAHTEPRISVPSEDEEVEAEERRLLQKVFAQIRARTGRDFTPYKRSTILRRIQRRMQLLQMGWPSTKNSRPGMYATF